MKKLIKILAIVTLFAIVSSLFGVAAYAEESADSSLSLDDVKFTFTYTSDSVVKEGMSYQTYSDPISNQSGIELVPNFGLGYIIYDDAETEIIDGIRINGAEVTSLRIPINTEAPVLEYTVAIRTVYATGASGDIAQIFDGTYDYTKLITNPIIIFQLLYWIFMAAAGFVGLVVAIKSKKLKVKSSDEIAAKVTENVDVFRDRLTESVTEIVKSEILPLAQASVKSGKEAVKAILLSNSSSKEAPSALLDVFKESSDIDISNIVDEVREELTKKFKESDEKRSSNIEMLKNIANHVIQEDVSDAKETTNESEVKTQKSIF